MLGPQTQHKGAVYGDDEYFTSNSRVFSADYHPRAIGASRGPSSSERPPRPMQGRACALQKQRNADSVIVHCLSITATTDVVSGSVSEQTDAYAEPPGTPGMYDDDADNGTPQGAHPIALARRTDRDTTGPRWTGSPNVSSRTTGLSPPEETTVGCWISKQSGASWESTRTSMRFTSSLLRISTTSRGSSSSSITSCKQATRCTWSRSTRCCGGAQEKRNGDRRQSETAQHCKEAARLSVWQACDVDLSRAAAQMARIPR